MASILIVDDDVQTRELYVSLLTPFGHQVLEAGDGVAGLEQARLAKPDLIISDILMPSMNGYEFVSTLRRDPALNKVPVIFHSASFLDRQARSLGAACGVSLFILKPCEPEQALATVQKALGLKAVASPAIPSTPNGDPIPQLLDAFFEKGKKLDEVSLRLAALLELGLDLAHCKGSHEILRKAGNAARKIIGADYAGIGIAVEDKLQLRFFELFGAGPNPTSRFANATFCGTVFAEILRSRKSQRVSCPDGWPDGPDLPDGHPAIHSFLGTPLVVGAQLYGWMYVADKLGASEFSEGDDRILTALAAKVALAFENSERLRTIQEHAVHLEAEIEERKRAEDRFHVLVETAPTGIVIVDAKGRFVEVNAQALHMFGYERHELIGKTVETLVPDRLGHAHQGHVSGYLTNPHARPMGKGIELFARRKDGTEFPVEISLGPLASKEGVLISSTIVDITERREMQEQLRLSQRMEAIGQLAGGVAHDFNNLLAVILGCSDVLLDALPADHLAVSKIAMIRKAGASAADLTRQLLAFSRQQMLQPRVLNPKDIVEQTEALLRRLIGENIALKIALAPSLGWVKADPGQIEQVLLNLAVNARDAMPQGGALRIDAQNVELDGSYKDEHRQVVPGRYVMLAVEDTGSGMDRKTQARIFDPFFTTKELGKGTGLGLATVYGIVKQSGGYIWVYSELGKGTTFKVYLPRIEQNPQSEPRIEKEKSVSAGHETILLAEDSESLREMAREYLESEGYIVLAAATGMEALQLAKEFAGKIHLLLTDVVMPAMSGPELATLVESLRPGIRVIFTSGYTDDAIARQGVLDPTIAFIQKPYRPKALARKIREVLDVSAGMTPHDPPSDSLSALTSHAKQSANSRHP